MKTFIKSVLALGVVFGSQVSVAGNGTIGSFSKKDALSVSASPCKNVCDEIIDRGAKYINEVHPLAQKWADLGRGSTMQSVSAPSFIYINEMIRNHSDFALKSGTDITSARLIQSKCELFREEIPVYGVVPYWAAAIAIVMKYSPNALRDLRSCK